MKRKIRTTLIATITMALFAVIPASSFAESVTWSDSFVQNQTPDSGQCQAWHDFLNQLEPDIEFVSVTMSGTFVSEAVTITDPIAVQELAYLLYSRTPGSVISNGHTWYVGIGCNRTDCVIRGEGVELRIDQENYCACDMSAGYTIRPDMGYVNWGGVNTPTCYAPDQTMLVEFRTKPAMSPTIMIGECDSGVDNIMLSTGYSINDQIAECAANATNHGKFVSCVSSILNLLKKEGFVSGKDTGAIKKCATEFNMP